MSVLKLLTKKQFFWAHSIIRSFDQYDHNGDVYNIAILMSQHVSSIQESIAYTFWLKELNSISRVAARLVWSLR